MAEDICDAKCPEHGCDCSVDGAENLKELGSLVGVPDVSMEQHKDGGFHFCLYDEDGEWSQVQYGWHVWSMPEMKANPWRPRRGGAVCFSCGGRNPNHRPGCDMA